MGIDKLLLVFAFIITVSQLSCDPLASDNGSVYNFSVTAMISPSKDTVNVGDTLYLTSSFPTQLVDTKTGKLIDYSNNRGFGGSIGFNDFNKLGTNTDSSTTKHFTFFNVEGQTYNDQKVPVYWNSNQIQFEKINATYRLKIGMIPMKKGQYCFGISDLFCMGIVGQANFTSSATFIVSFVTTNQHLSLYENKFGQLSEHDSASTYCFVVK